MNPPLPHTSDLTERLQRAEEALHLARVGSFSWRLATDEITWSEQLYRIFEFEPQLTSTLELIATRVHPEDIPMRSDRAVCE